MVLKMLDIKRRKKIILIVYISYPAQ